MSMRRQYSSVKLTKDYLEVLEDPGVDAVCVSTPASTHYQVAKDSLMHGKHVLVEKPMTVNVRQAEELCALSEKTKKVLMVGHVYEYHPCIKKLKELIESGELGEIYYLYLTRTGLGPVRNDVNVLWDLASHDISILLYLIKTKPTQVSAVGSSYLQANIEDVAFMTLSFPHNIIANIHVSWLDAVKIRKTTIIGSKKMVVFDDTESLERVKIFGQGLSFAPLTSYGEFRLLLRRGDIHIPNVKVEEPLKIECQHFLDCIQSNAKPRTDGREGIKAIKILEKAQESLEHSGKLIELRL